MERKEKQEGLHNPEKCPCLSTDCVRNRNCEACMAYHHGSGSLTACERKQARR